MNRCGGRGQTPLVPQSEHRKLIIDLAIEPTRKGPADTRSALEFRRQVMDQMERYHRYLIRGYPGWACWWSMVTPISIRVAGPA